MEGTAISKLLKSDMRVYADKDLLVIGANGEQLGVMKLGPACQAAKDAGLDLVMVAETSEPPVCRIMNFGKLLYEQKKKLKDQKKNQQAQKVKEIKFRLNIAEHDYAHKIEQGIEFLDDGETVPEPDEPGPEPEPGGDDPEPGDDTEPERPMTIAEMRQRIRELEETLNIIMGVVE